MLVFIVCFVSLCPKRLHVHNTKYEFHNWKVETLLGSDQSIALECNSQILACNELSHSIKHDILFCGACTLVNRADPETTESGIW